MAAFHDGNSVIEIHPGEIYGKMLELEAPKRAGVYHLEGEIMPPAFTKNQSKELMRENKKFLDNPCIANGVTITVK
jgi:hypothetical protein